MCTTADPPASSVASGQCTTDPFATQPESALTNTAPGGRLSSTATPRAGSGPAFAAVMV